MKKKLNTIEVMNELRGQSVFFPTRPAEPIVQQEDIPVSDTHISSSNEKPGVEVIASNQASNNASIDASKHASTLALEVDLKGIHKTLKLIGKEVLYVRLTPEEKNHVNDIEYTYQRQGIKTSGNEIGRIALNFILADYKANGEQSILAKLLTELHT